MLFVSITKWIFLASCIGILVGASTAIFLKLLNGGIMLTSRVPYLFLFILHVSASGQYTHSIDFEKIVIIFLLLAAIAMKPGALDSSRTRFIKTFRADS